MVTPDDRQASRQVGYRNILNLGLVSLFTDASTEMIVSILPAFIVLELGATKLLYGVIEGFGEALSYGVRMFSGVLSDKIGKRKVIVLVGYTLSTATKPLFAFARIWTDAFAVRSIERSGKGIRTAPRDALLSDSVPLVATGKAFGIHRTLDQAGAIVGPVLAIVLGLVTTYRNIFLLSLIPAFIAVAILLFFVREVAPQASEASVLGGLREVLRGRFLLLLGLVALFSVGAYNPGFVLIKSNELGIAATLLPVIYLVIQAVHTGVGIPFGALADRIGKEKVLILGYLALLLASLAAVASVGGLSLPFLLAALFGLYQGITETVQRAVVPEYVTSTLRGTAYGAYYLVVGASFLVANVVFGYLWDLFGSGAAFSYSVTTSILAIAGLAAFVLTKPRSSARTLSE